MIRFRERNAKMKFVNLLLCTILLMSLVACGSGDAPVQPSVDAAKELSWLEGVPCQLPCWEGVTPTVTSSNAALTRLKQITFITSVNSDQANKITAKWSNDKSVVLGHKEEIIRSISLNFANSFALEKVIAKYGLPSKVLAFREGEANKYTYNLNLIFEAYNFILSDNSVNPAIKEAMTFTKLNTFGTKEELLASVTQGDKEGYLVDWSGFNTFMFYCRAKVMTRILSCS